MIKDCPFKHICDHNPNDKRCQKEGCTVKEPCVVDTDCKWYMQCIGLKSQKYAHVDISEFIPYINRLKVIRVMTNEGDS
jgi:hypothetical protein